MCVLCLHQGLLLENQQSDLTPVISGSLSMKLIAEKMTV